MKKYIAILTVAATFASCTLFADQTNKATDSTSVDTTAIATALAADSIVAVDTVVADTTVTSAN